MKKGFTTIKRLLSLIMVFAMVLTLLPTVAFAAESETRIIYLDTGGSSLWNADTPWFAAWVWGETNSGEWYTLTDVNGTVYRAEIPADSTGLIFCRMDPAQTDPSWDSGLWNKTGDLAVGTDNYYSITAWRNDTNVCDGEWSNDEPTLTIAGTISPAGWTPASGERMTDDDEDGIYEYTYTNVAAGSYEFKVTDGTWDNSWGNGSNNYAVSVAYSGSTVTIKFNAEKKTITTTVTPPSYAVTFNGTGVSSNGAKTVTAGNGYSATLTAADGYTLPESITVKSGDADVTHTYSKDTGALSIEASAITGNITITAVGVEEETESSTITVYFRNDWLWTDVCIHYWGSSTATATTWPGMAMTKVGTAAADNEERDVYSATIPADVTGIIFNGIKNDGSGARDQTPDITGSIENGNAYYIKWDGSQNNWDTFDYTPSTGGEGGDTDPAEYTVTFNGTNVTSNGAEKVTEGNDYTATLTAAEGYTLPESITVKSGDADVAHTYSKDTGALSIEASAITGNIAITAVGVEEETESSTITVYFRNDWLWPEVCIYYWNASGNNTWPGAVMTKVDTVTTEYGDRDVYSATIPADVTGIIFNGLENGNNSSRQQTTNVETGIADGNAYYIYWDGSQNNWRTFDYTPSAGGDEGGDSTDPTSYEVTFHFVNTQNWSTVNLYTWSADGKSTQLTGGWPGTALSEGEDGYYSKNVTYEAAANQGLNFIFNDGSTQTVDLKLEASAFTDNKAEVWVVPTTMTDGNYNADILESPDAIVTSPVVDGTSVTFEYRNADAASVEVRGTMNSWESGTAMTKKNDYGVWTVTIDDLEPGSYEYKFYVDGAWVADPCNPPATDGGNSVFLILDPNAEDTNTVTVRIHYSRTDSSYDGWNLWVWNEKISGHQEDFTTTDDNGAQVCTIVLEDARAYQSLSFIPRYSTDSDDWEKQESEFVVDLSDIVSGTIDYYAPAGTRVLGTDVVKAVKLVSCELDYDTGAIVITTGTTIEEPENAFELIEDDETTDFTIADVDASGTTYTLTLEEGQKLDLVQLYKYQIEFQGYTYAIGINSVYASDKFAEEYTYAGEDLGANWTSGSTTFKVWAPTAESVSVNLYTSGTEGANDRIGDPVAMTQGDNGVWSVTVSGDQNGKYYTYSVEVGGQTVEAVDPYARTTGVNGKRGMVINLDSTDPSGWASDGNPNPLTSYTDAVLYELHVRDFSIDSSSGMTNKGKYLAFTEQNTTVPGTSISTGVSYLKDLGVTHVHLLPVYDYGSVDETTSNTFNWGYDPVNFNVPEGSYSTNPSNGATRVNEFKQMVQSLHNNDISVIMDVVYNHVYDADTFCFNQIVPGYFSRTLSDGSYSNASGCGNETASEREMVRKYIVESILYWVEEYHIDGFRFDLVAILDTDTINEIVDEVHKVKPGVIFYGEGWTAQTPHPEEGTTLAYQANASLTSGFAYFSDSMRNLLAGNNGNSLGFASGSTGRESEVVSNFKAQPSWSSNPQQVVQYVSCHDNYTLADKLIKSTGASGITDNIISMNNLSAAIYMTSQGIPFIHAGEEMLRRKLDASGSPVENSYNASDSVNAIKWSNLQNENNDDTHDYYQGLIQFRKAHAALRYSTAAKVSANVKNKVASGNVVAFQIDGNGAGDDDIYVIFNANSAAKTVDLPDGTWTININKTDAGTASLGTATGSVSVDGISAMVLTKADEGKDEADSAEAGMITLYFSNNKGWDKVYAYAWGGSEDMSWPGKEMTYVETNDYGESIYSITVPATITGIIFNNGNGVQTVDITTIGVDGTGYYCLEESDGKWTVGTYKYRDPITSTIGTEDEYFLFGWINGAEYAGADYKFEDGTLTTTFENDSYVYVSNGTYSEKYMTDGWLGSVTSATLYDTAEYTLSSADKMMIPGGVEVTFTLTVNEDDNTVNLSYTAAKDTSSYSATDTSGIQNGMTLHCWNWSFEEIEKNMATIAEQGYTAIQTSPVQPLKENTADVSTEKWWLYYQPVDFVITTDSGNALGTKSELQSMITTAHQYGVKVIVDVVANHLANETGNNLSPEIPEEIRNNSDYWHDITINITSWSNREDMTQHCMSGLPDLNTANDEIQTMVLDFLKECVDAGVDGFRFDAAKSIETPDDDSTFASDFWPTVIGGAEEYAETKGKDIYCYGEVLDDPAINVSAYTKYMALTDNSWGNTLRGNISNGTAAISAGYNKAAAASQLVLWAESHDTYADGTSSGVSEANINKTWALVAARADAMGLYLARPESMTQALGTASVTGWANDEVQAVNVFHNAFVGQSESVDNEGGISYVERGTTGVVLVNAAGTTASVSVTANAMADGSYVDQITGNTFTVADGKITGEIGSTGIAVVYNPVEPAAKHTVTIAETVGGTVAVSNANPVTGETVIITVQADAGKVINEVTVTDEDGNPVAVTDEGDGTYTYVQPDSDVTIAVTFRKGAPSTGTKHTVTIKKTADGKVRVSSKVPETGETVTITVMPDAGMLIDKVIVTDENGKTVEVTDHGNGTYTYVQPDSDVTIVVTFRDDDHTVTIKKTNGGKVTVSDETPKTGDTVTITATPNSGKVVNKVIVTDANGKKIAVTDHGNGTYTFVQPDSDVTVKVTFKASFLSSSGSPLTGDNSGIQLWCGIGLVSLLLLFALLIGKQKKFAKK